MKRTLMVFTLVIATAIAFAQAPPSPPSDPGAGGNGPVGGGAPIGSGLFLLLTLGAAYGGRKVLNLNKALPDKE